MSGGTPNRLNSIFFTDENSGYAVGWYGTILKTSDGGGVYIEEKERPLSTFCIYPNPSGTKITISSNNKLNEDFFYTIFSIDGTQVMQGKLQNQKSVELDVSFLTKGAYLVKIQTPQGLDTKMLIIQ
jgi:hypothetical protein